MLSKAFPWYQTETAAFPPSMYASTHPSIPSLSYCKQWAVDVDFLFLAYIEKDQVRARFYVLCKSVAGPAASEKGTETSSSEVCEVLERTSAVLN